jgi:L-threonylcarbamoyladenylate synthase
MAGDGGSRVLRLDREGEGGIREGISLLREGGIVVYPTDTLYALGCDALNPTAVERVFSAKHRPREKPLPIAVSDLEMMKRYAVLDSRAEAVALRFLPGPLTLVLPRIDLPPVLTGPSSSVAIRIPDHSVALGLVRGLGRPITTTSANLSGRPPPVSVGEAREQIEGVDLYLDAGPLPHRVPSTLLDLTGRPKLLREGRVKREALEPFLGPLE